MFLFMLHSFKFTLIIYCHLYFFGRCFCFLNIALFIICFVWSTQTFGVWAFVVLSIWFIYLFYVCIIIYFCRLVNACMYKLILRKSLFVFHPKSNKIVEWWNFSLLQEYGNRNNSLPQIKINLQPSHLHTDAFSLCHEGLLIYLKLKFVIQYKETVANNLRGANRDKCLCKSRSPNHHFSSTQSIRTGYFVISICNWAFFGFCIQQNSLLKE